MIEVLNFRRHLLKYVLSLLQCRFYWMISAVLDDATAMMVRHRLRSERSGSVVIPTEGNGNIGDAAMLEACLANTARPISLIVEEAGSHPGWLLAQADEVIVIKGLVARRTLSRLAARQKLLRILRYRSDCLIIGADIMDGSYNRSEAYFRIRLLRLCSKMATRGRLVGFSWGPHPDTQVLAALRKISRDVPLFVRDPVSWRRLASVGIESFLAADLAFSLQWTEGKSEAMVEPSSDGFDGLVVMNMSGLNSSLGSRIPVYVELLERVLNAQKRVLLLPHVIRQGDSDLDALRSLTCDFPEAVASGQIKLVDSLLRPRDVYRLAQQADFLITSRMHLAILGLLAGTPVAAFESHGKVAGLMESLDVKSLLISDGAETRGSANKTIGLLLSDRQSFVDAIRRNMPSLITRSGSQFQ